MIENIAAKLFDTSPGGRPLVGDKIVSDVTLPAPRHAAVIALSKMINDASAPKIDLNKITYDEKNVQKWREWWQANSNEYCNSSSNEVVKAKTP
ncbi:MAG: hypothetical protein L6437_10690 [Kiritimatiellae bacterium]|nr:hypothetical protein [Kiritimatiellia bacterium]